MRKFFWKKFKKKEWVEDVKGRFDVIVTYCATEALANFFREVLPEILPKNFYIEQKYIDNQYYHREDQVNFLIKIIKESPKIVLKTFIKKNYKLLNRMLRTTKKIAKNDFQRFSNQKLCKYFEKFIHVYTNTGVVFVAPIVFENIFLEFFKGLPLEKLLVSPKKTVGFKEKISLLRVAYLLKRGKIEKSQIEKQLEKIVGNFSWTGFLFFTGKPKTTKDYLEKIKELEKGDPVGELKNLIKHQSDILKEKQRLMKSLSLNPQQKNIIFLGSELVFLRTRRIEFFSRTTAIIDPLLREISLRLSLSRGLLIYMTPEEISKSLIEGRLLISKKILKSRLRAYACYLEENKKPKIVCGKDISLVRHHTEKIIIQETQKIKGITGFSGIVRGKVKVINSLKKGNKLNRGDILVVETTTPDWVPLLEKVSAIITDRGGITCHAAIVARELKKPCIIGTKIATRVLKNGDLVEVDAGRGVVKILKRK